MRGTPLFRLLFLALFLFGAAVLVARLAHPPATVAQAPSSSPPTTAGETRIPAFVEIILSAPAQSFHLRGEDLSLPATLREENPPLALERELTLVLTEDGRTRDRATVIWQNPTQSNFLLLSFEPEGLETKQTTLHFPPGTETLPLDLSWAPALPSTDTP